VLLEKAAGKLGGGRSTLSPRETAGMYDKKEGLHQLREKETAFRGHEWFEDESSVDCMGGKKTVIRWEKGGKGEPIC